MLLPYLVFTVDPTLGRLDFSLLSDQARMEMVFAEVAREELATNMHVDEHGEFTDVCAWKGVTCDGGDHVTALSFFLYCADGTLSLAYLPPSIVNFTLSGNCHTQKKKLYGRLRTADLPPKVEESEA